MYLFIIYLFNIQVYMYKNIIYPPGKQLNCHRCWLHMNPNQTSHRGSRGTPQPRIRSYSRRQRQPIIAMGECLACAQDDLLYSINMYQLKKK